MFISRPVSLYFVSACFAATFLCCAPASFAQSQGNNTTNALVEFPHPLITEVLYAVPTGIEGDANHDGVRSATGDEFVELVNPHDTPINIKGYELSDWNAQFPASDSGWRMTLPHLTLQPGECVVVFNGLDQQWDGSVGDSTRAPNEPYSPEAGALGESFVLTSRNDSKYIGFNNMSDLVMLTDPEGTAVHVIAWQAKTTHTAPARGKNASNNRAAQDRDGSEDDLLADLVLPASCTIERVAPVRRQSVHRPRATGPLVPHTEADGLPYSPGRWPILPQ